MNRSRTMIGLAVILAISTAFINVENKPFLANNKKETMKSTGAFLEITLKVSNTNRGAAAEIYTNYKQPFLDQISGSLSKELLIRTEDVQVLHGFETEAQAKAYLETELFSKDIVSELGPLLDADPEVRIYTVFNK